MVFGNLHLTHSHPCKMISWVLKLFFIKQLLSPSCGILFSDGKCGSESISEVMWLCLELRYCSALRSLNQWISWCVFFYWYTAYGSLWLSVGYYQHKPHHALLFVSCSCSKCSDLMFNCSTADPFSYYEVFIVIYCGYNQISILLHALCQWFWWKLTETTLYG